MASKRSTARKTSGKRNRQRKEHKKLLTKAQARITRLLKKVRGGTLAQPELKTGLEEIKGHLKAMEPFDWYHHHRR